MSLFIKLVTVFYILIPVYKSVNGQTTIPIEVPDTTYTLIGDTLFTDKGFKFYKGQILKVGNGSGENGWFNTITFRSGASWPLLLWKKMDEKDPDYQLDPSIRIKDNVKLYLNPGSMVKIKKFKRYGKARWGYWYKLILHTTEFPRITFTANIPDAIRTKELIIPEDVAELIKN